MKITFDVETGIVCMYLAERPVDVSQEIAPGFIVDFDASGEVVAFEILDGLERYPGLFPLEHVG